MDSFNFHAFLTLFQYKEGQPMLFNSGEFFILFSAFYLVYYFLRKTIVPRLVFVIAFSFLFYYKASGWYLGILLTSIVIDYFLALAIDGIESKKAKTALLIASISANVGLLLYFKYTNFFILNWNALAGGDLSPMDIFLPIGISFYTFQTLSYIIDVYKGLLKPVKSFWDYCFYMSFFPHLVAGPIVRAKDFLPQVRIPIQLTQSEVNIGFYLIIKGLIKKAIIADYLAQYVDVVFQSHEGYSGFENLIAVYAYTLQIFCDFSGYTDIAIGIAKWMGYQLGDNFNSPYKAQNITDFWRRWHISLSSWLRDYIYIPLGGNQKGIKLQYVFLFLTMLIGGFWHGADWKFVFWGAMHGLALALHKLWIKATKDKLPNNALLSFLGWFITFHFVAWMWIYFRADSFQTANGILSQIFWNFDWNFIAPFWKVRKLLLILSGLALLLQIIPKPSKSWIEHQISDFPLLGKVFILAIVIQLALQFRIEGIQPFIYFQF